MTLTTRSGRLASLRSVKKGFLRETLPYALLGRYSSHGEPLGFAGHWSGA